MALLYMNYGWSAPRIAKAAGTGRRAVENALERVGVELRTSRAARPWPKLSDNAALAWLASYTKDDDALIQPPTRVVQGVVTYRRRTCWRCARLTSYAIRCPACGALVNAPPPEPETSS